MNLINCNGHDITKKWSRKKVQIMCVLPGHLSFPPQVKDGPPRLEGVLSDLDTSSPSMKVKIGDKKGSLVLKGTLIRPSCRYVSLTVPRPSKTNQSMECTSVFDKVVVFNEASFVEEEEEEEEEEEVEAAAATTTVSPPRPSSS